jgi:MSHA biogenesis protein MshM
MIHSYFGITAMPFASERLSLLSHQQEIYDILMVHAVQGGLSLLLGEPGTGKSLIKETFVKNSGKQQVVITISRTLHTYTNIIKMLCDAMNVEFSGTSFALERRLIEAALGLYRSNRSLVIIIDDAHLLEMETLRKIRLLLEDFPKNHNLILAGQPELLSNMSLSVNTDIRSRVTYSVIMKKLIGDELSSCILSQLDRVGLGHNVFTEDALHLIVRSSDGILRSARNLTLASMLEAVRHQQRTVTLEMVNAVLIQPHWRKAYDFPDS